MTLRLDGQHVTQISFDYAITLLTESGFKIRLETLFVVRDPVGTELPVEPEDAGAMAARVLELLHRLIDFATVESSGTLNLTFVDGYELNIEPHPQFEAWGIVGPGKFMLVALPGGGVAECAAENEGSSE